MMTDKYKKDDQSIEACKHNTPLKYGFGVRHIQVLILFICLTVNCIDKGHIGVTIVAMTNNQKENASNFNTTMDIIIGNYSLNDTDDTLMEYYDNMENSQLKDVTIYNVIPGIYEDTIPTFNWTKSRQETILGFFYIGYSVTMLPIGVVCHRWGGKIPLQTTLFVNALVTTATPWLHYWGDWKAACFCRFLQGLAQVTMFPCLHTLIAKWVPSSEFVKLTSFIYTGVPLGNVLAPQLGGFLAASRYGWLSTYWALGIINFISFLLLTVLGSETPLKHSRIKEEERNYILKSTNIDNHQQLKIPWKAIFTSKPLWATIVAHVGKCFCFIFFITEVPSYIYYIYGNDIKSSGLLSSLPYVGSIITSSLFGWLSDYVTNKKMISATNARRIFNTISHCGFAIALICVAYTNNIILAVTYLTIAMSADVACYAGYLVSYIDLAPNFSGFLMIIGSAFMTVFIVLLPVLVSFVVTDVTDIIQWRTMIFIIAGLSVASNIVYILMVSAQTQPWNNVDHNNEVIEEQKNQPVKEKTRL